MDDNSILARLDERSKSIKIDVENVLHQLEKLNSKVASHEQEIKQIQLKLAVSQGHWSGVNKTILIFLTIMGIAIGAIATKLWH